MSTPPPQPWDPGQAVTTGQGMPPGSAENGQEPPPGKSEKCPCGAAFAGKRGEPFTAHYFAVHTKDGKTLNPAASLDKVPDSEVAAATALKVMLKDSRQPVLFGQQTRRWLLWEAGVYEPQDVTFGSGMALWFAVAHKVLLTEIRQMVRAEVAEANPGAKKAEIDEKTDVAMAAWKGHYAYRKTLWSEHGQAALIRQLERSCGIDESKLDAGTGEIVVDNWRISYDQILRSYQPGQPGVLPFVQPLGHDPEILVTKRMGKGVYYDPAATCPVFDQFLATSVADPAQRGWLCWRVINALFGRMPRKGFVNPIGETDSGKTAFETLMHALGGNYVITVPVATFMAKHAGDSGFLADELRGARMVCAAEPKPGGRYDDGYMKDITGRGSQRTAGKWAKPVQWIPQCTPFIASNAPIRFATSDEAMMERQEAIRFARGYQVKDDFLDARLAAELPGILNRLLEAVLWEAQHGLPPLPASMITERERLADETEPALRFITEWLEKGWLAEVAGLPVSSYAQVDPLFHSYQDWCDSQEGVRAIAVLGRQGFREVVGRRYPAQKSNGYRFVGLVVRGQVI